MALGLKLQGRAAYFRMGHASPTRARLLQYPRGIEAAQPRNRRAAPARPATAPAAVALVRALDPDILVLNEALFCRAHAGTAVDYGGLFAFRHAAAALYDGAWGNVILSQHPITRSAELRIVRGPRRLQAGQ